MAIHVLIIDDQASQRKVIKNLFEAYGYEVTALDSPEEALYLLEYNAFPVIVTDLKMPWMDGAEFCVRARKIYPDVLIYALSGHLDDFDRRKLGRAGFDQIFTKPVKIQNLHQTIAEDMQSRGGADSAP